MIRPSKHSLLLTTAFALAITPLAATQEEPEETSVETTEQDERTLQTVVLCSR